MIKSVKTLYGGLFLIALISFTSIYFSEVGIFKSAGVSSLIIAIILGVIYGNTVHHRTPSEWFAGISFAQKRLLRLGIILYGFRITFQQIAQVGVAAMLLDVFVVSSILLLGYFLGVKLFKLDKKLSVMIACGSSICGAAAVLGAEPVVKARPHETSIAVATVVIFGTIAMFLFAPIVSALGYPVNWQGIALGSTVHEVAQVVAAGSAISEEVTDIAVIVKLARVMLLIPVLIVLGFIFGRNSGDKDSSIMKVFPWFAIFFVVASGVNSLHIIPQAALNWINIFDNFLLTMAMAALGVETNMGKVRQVGIKPFLLAGVIFLILIAYLFIPTFLAGRG